VEEAVPGTAVALLAMALEGVVMRGIEKLGGGSKERGPFLAEPAGAFGPLSERLCKSEVFGTDVYSGAAAVEEGSCEEASPGLEARLAGLSLIWPEEWSMSGASALPGVPAQMFAIRGADLGEESDSEVKPDKIEHLPCF
jgi:hypothetical protein